jgi:hypothetical protein
MIHNPEVLELKLKNGQSIIDIFDNHRIWYENLFESRANKNFEKEIEQAEKDLTEWERQSGANDNCAPEVLATKRLLNLAAQDYESKKYYMLAQDYSLIQSTISKVIQEEIAPIMTEATKKNGKLGIVELAARFTPVLNFPGSSSFFNGMYLPYGKEIREQFGEQLSDKFVNQETAFNSASNMINLGAGYVLAETSMAPTSFVPYNGRLPEIHICGLKKEGNIFYESHEINTQLRKHFDAKVMELMYFALKKLYTE